LDRGLLTDSQCSVVRVLNGLPAGGSAAEGPRNVPPIDAPALPPLG
jgi:hypothetical protein